MSAGGLGATDAAARVNATDALARTTAAVQAVQAMQNAARAAATASGTANLGLDPNHPGQPLPNVPNGLVLGGLQAAPGAAPNSSLWQGASLPKQSQSNGQTVVEIQQTSPTAVLNWKTFNIGSKTVLEFDQTIGGAQSGQWIAFNKINDPSGSPSQILGSIQALGQVYVVNANGIIFGGTSQVNIHAFVASSLPINDNLISSGLLNNPDDQFLFSSLAIPAGPNGPTPAFTPPTINTPSGQPGDVVVQAGATLTAPSSAASVGGKIALIGPNVINSGTISVPDGQAILAAGNQVAFQAHTADTFLRGLDVFVGAVGSSSGVATNNGLINAREGDVSMTAKTVNQLGVIDSSTSVSLNGRVDLSASHGATVVSFNTGDANTDIFTPTATGTVTLGPSSVTRILPELSSTQTVVGTTLALPSIINISGEAIHFAADSQVLAPNATVNVSAGGWYQSGNTAPTFIPNGGQIYFDAGATINVAGSIVSAPMSENIISAELLGPQLANSPLQQNGVLYGQTIQVDVRNSGVMDGRYWIGTPVADVTGYAALIQRNVGELTVAGGTVNLSAGDSVVMQSGSEVNVSGGAINYSGGMMQTTRLISNGRLVNIANASPDVAYSAIYTGTTTVTDAKLRHLEYLLPAPGAHWCAL